MNPIIKQIVTVVVVLLGFLPVWASAATYSGRVLDAQGQPVSFATVYLRDNPVCGTATGNDGEFRLDTDADPASMLIISFIGYEKQELPLSQVGTIVLKEQPIALEETVVAAKASKQKNKRKAMAQLLYKVYNRMQYDFSDSPTRYRIVSDVRMKSDDIPWGMEQMIASVVNIPGVKKDNRDSVQFASEYCKRFFQQSIRDRADTILAADWLDKRTRKLATEMDSGVVVHKGLWAMGNICYDFESTMNDLRHWTVSNESENETVLTHTESHNYLGIFKYEYKRHYIVHSETFAVLRFSESLQATVNIPFGYRFRQDDLELLNLLNMSEKQIEKFRLRKATATVTLNTLYQKQGGKTFPLEKNLRTEALMTGTQKQNIPILVEATQRVTSVTSPAEPMKKSQMTKRVKREIVPVY